MFPFFIRIAAYELKQVIPTSIKQLKQYREIREI